MIEAKAKIIEKKFLTPDVLEITFKLNEKMKFTPGQFISLQIKTKDSKIQYRSYSIANHPNDSAKIIRIVIKTLEGGLASNYLREKNLNDEVVIRGGAGLFSYRSKGVKDVYMICTGTGIVPLMSMVENQLQSGSKENINLFFGVRYKEDIFYKELLETLENDYSNFKYYITLSKPVKNWHGYKGYVTDFIKQLDFENGHFYLCGLPQMIIDAKQTLLKNNTPKESIFEEHFVSIGKMLTERNKK